MATTGQPIQCTGECTVTIQLAPAPPSEENIADITLIGGVLMVFLGTVYAASALLRWMRRDEG